METMEQAVTDDSIIKGVEFLSMRNNLIAHLLELSDADFQMRKWIDPDCDDGEGKNNSFWNEINFTFDFFDDFNLLDDDLEKVKRRQYDAIGLYLKSEEEAEIICKVAEVLDALSMSCYTNEEISLIALFAIS